MNRGEKKMFFSEVDQAIRRVCQKIRSIRALFIYDKEGQITLFQHIDQAFTYNEGELGQISMLPTYLSQIYQSLQEQISKINLADNESVSVMYDKYMLLQFKIGDNLRSTVLTEGDEEVGIIEQLVADLKTNFGHIDGAVSEEN